MDVNGGTVSLSFARHSFSKDAEHVLVICQFYGQWLLTKHKLRGWEFPGGKKEPEETLEQAAIREVDEETGARIKTLTYLGEYEVTNGDESFVKAIYYAEIESMQTKENYFETNGPVLVCGDISSLRFQETYSFIMKDQVVEKAVEKVISLVQSERHGNS